MFLDDIVSPLTVKEAATDYQKRRQRERDVDAGKPVSRQPKNPQTDYAKKRARDKKELELGEEQVNELSKGTLANYVKANANDQVQHASSQSYVSGKNGDKYNTSDAWDQRTTKREKGMDRALNKLSQVEEDSWHAGDNAWSSDKNQWSESMDVSEPSPVASAITRRILSQRLDLLKQYGPELVGAAVDNVADYVGDVEEIGSSDVSAWVNQVERMLRDNPPEAFGEGVAEGEGGLGQVAGIGINGKQFNFSIKDLIAKAQNYPIKKLNPQLFVKQLADRHEDPKQTAARAQAADLQYPIIVVQDGNTLMIADGTHRAQKAIMNKLPSINAYVIPVEDMAEFSKQGVAEGSEQQYLWHGSRQKIPMLEPRQSVDTGGAAGSNQNAIYATSDPKVAIAMGLTTPGSDTGMFPNDPQMVLFSGKIRKGENVYLHKVPMNGPDGKPQFVQGGNSREFHSVPGVKGIKPTEIKAVPVDKYLNLIRQATPQDLELRKKYMKQGVAEGNWSNVIHTTDRSDEKAQREQEHKKQAGLAATVLKNHSHALDPKEIDLLTRYNLHHRGKPGVRFDRLDNEKAQQLIQNVLRFNQQGVAEGYTPDTNYSYTIVGNGDESKAYDSKEEARDAVRKLGAGYKIKRKPRTSARSVKKHFSNRNIDEESSTSSEAVEIALIRRVLVAHTDLIMNFGLDKVTQAIEEVAYNVGDVDEIGTSDVSGWIHQVKQILGVEA